MSNPAVKLLIETRIANNILRVEDNLGESIHIHFGAFRFEVSIDEFFMLSDIIINAATDILKETGLDFNSIDPTAFLWGWTDSIMNIESSTIENVALNELLSTYTYKYKNLSTELICGIKDTRIVRALRGDTNMLEEYSQYNYFNESNFERLERLLNSVKELGYPYQNKYIVIDQNYRVLDGDHRAGCLYHLYGDDYKVPVIMVHYKNKTKRHLSIKEIENINKNRIDWNTKTKVHSPIRAIKKDEVLEPKVKFNEFINYLNRFQYIIIQRCLMDVIYRNKVDVEIMIKKEHFSDTINYLNTNAKRIDNTFRKYGFIYSLTIPRLYQLKDKVIVVSCELFCKSYFEDMLMPLDIYIQSKAWETAMENRLSDEVSIIYLLSKKILHKEKISLDEMNYIKRNINLVKTQSVKEMLYKVFFKFTDELIYSILNDEYDKIQERYTRYSKY